MNILVCISSVPDTTTKISFTENNTKFNSSGVQYIINPYDELALTRAIELIEVNGGEVHVINVGTAENDPIIRKALAIGANKAIRVNTIATDGMLVAKEIANIFKGGSYDIILTGRESIDYNGGQVAGLLGAILEIPSVNIVSHLEVNGSNVIARRDIDGGHEEVSVPMPCVISAQKDLTEPRIPNMRGIMQARTKPLDVAEPVSGEGETDFISYELPPAKAEVKLIDPDNAGELIDLLRNEKKLL